MSNCKVNRNKTDSRKSVKEQVEEMKASIQTKPEKKARKNTRG